MNEEFVSLFTSNIEALVSSLEFTHKPTNTKKVPQVVEMCMDEPGEDYKEAQEYPYVRWIIYKGAFSWKSPAPFNIRIDLGIYTAGTKNDGSREIQSLCLAVGKLVEKPWYRPYKLMNSIPFTIGNPYPHFEGVQPHPYHLASLYPEFKVANGHGG